MPSCKHPKKCSGSARGDDYKLSSYDQQLAYYRQLAEESDRVMIREIGESVLGRPLVLLTISSVTNLASLDSLSRHQHAAGSSTR